MFSRIRLIALAAAVAALATLNTAGAGDPKQIDGGKGSAFKSKSYNIKEKGKAVVVLSFEAGKEVTVRTKAEKETDINLFVKGRYFEAKDTSPGPNCLIKFTPVQGDERFTFTIKNDGPGANRVTLQVKVAK